MNGEASISVKQVSFGYRKASHDIKVLGDVNLDFYEKDFVGIVGLNGTGKSTFLKSLCGLLPLLSGTIKIDGRGLEDFSLEALSKKISIVLTERIGGFNLTGYDVVATGQMPYTDSFNRITEEHKRIIESAIEVCGIKDHQYKLITELSDGLFQKTIIAKALAQQTPILLLDEPGAFLDYASKHDLFLLLKKLCGTDNKCVLVSSHDLDLLLKYCNKLLLISGEGAALISTKEAAQNAIFKKIGGGFI